MPLPPDGSRADGYREPKKVGPGALKHAGARWTIVLVPTTVDGLHLAAGGYAFKAIRPSCPKGCSSQLWGHGWVLRYFAAVASSVRIQRFRCRRCRAVVTPRPEGFWQRFQTPVAEIAAALKTRLVTRRWPTPSLRQRCGHWLRGLVQFAAFEAPGENPLSGLERFHKVGVHFLV